VVAMLQRYFNLPIGNVITADPPIDVRVNRIILHQTVAVRPSMTYIPKPPNPGPLNLGPPPCDMS
ncbi:490_t:CDS:2, partial [Racocetra persica]